MTPIMKLYTSKPVKEQILDYVRSMSATYGKAMLNGKDCDISMRDISGKMGRG
jgi:hypothetical protein